MWRSKKFIIVTVLAAVMLTGSIGGTVVAADNGDDNAIERRIQHAVEAGEMTEEQANKLAERLRGLVAWGQITQQQARARLQTLRPD